MNFGHTIVAVTGILFFTACDHSAPQTAQPAASAPDTTAASQTAPPSSTQTQTPTAPPGAATGSEMERLSKEAETIHDEAMKTMAEMNRLKRQFKKLLTEMPQNAPDRKPYMDAVAQMEKAENGMMDWMTNYREPAPNTMPEQAIRYLREQKSKIEQNRKDIDDALAAGQKLLKK